MIMVGNKADLSSSSRRVKTEEAEEQAKSWKIQYTETSAKTYMNVDEAFDKLLTLIHARKKAQQQVNGTKKMKGTKKKRRCTIL